jgi:hypothetical protein
MKALVHQGKVIGTDDMTDLKSPSKSYITISQVCFEACQHARLVADALYLCSGCQREACGAIEPVSAAAANCLNLVSVSKSSFDERNLVCRLCVVVVVTTLVDMRECA